MNKNKKSNNQKSYKQAQLTPSVTSTDDIPDSFQLINKYGTYEIQPTADTDNKFPAIAQGLPKKEQDHEQLNKKNSDK